MDLSDYYIVLIDRSLPRQKRLEALNKLQTEFGLDPDPENLEEITDTIISLNFPPQLVKEIFNV